MLTFVNLVYGYWTALKPFPFSKKFQWLLVGGLESDFRIPLQVPAEQFNAYILIEKKAKNQPELSLAQLSPSLFLTMCTKTLQYKRLSWQYI